MTGLAHEYDNEIVYTHGYCDELNPLRARLPLLHAGFDYPVIRNACELGFGFGVSANIHAAGSDVHWYGVDADPRHSAFAQQLADDAQTPAHLFPGRFAEFCRRDDLPDFEFIGLHGVWSWIPDEDRATIAGFINRKLKPGGVLYISYNTQPGWAAMMPVRELMHGHFMASRSHHTGGNAPDERHATERIKAAVAFAQKVMAARPGYAHVNPSVIERVNRLCEENPRYLSHEYFAHNWYPASFLQVAQALEPAGVTYLASADYRDHVDSINLLDAQRDLLADIDDLTLSETTRDLCINRSFRRDYWIKQPRALEPNERLAALRAHRLILPVPEWAVSLKIRGALGETTLPEAVYRPVLQAMADARVTTLGAIEREVSKAGITLEQVIEAVKLLIAAGPVLNAQDEQQIQVAQSSARRLNTVICERAYDSDALQFLASPVSGSGVAVPHVAQLFLLAAMRGFKEPRQWAEFAQSALSGTQANDGAANMPAPLTPDHELVEKAVRFAEVFVPALKMLLIGEVD
ncbi:methyltransferase regulatory domain-containing protein [Paraburkholderia edwinii]|uniref:Methyltransferase regulatory domain-containing protein n=1 Tax=Paraburkholderia edwinii TaxID=2861782 RepID=A0ABX8UH49_9BURK|nr:methyltransferase regulatory domain-containing protein [Paraburkholderia edwinii]QYD68178.1 methyltransferase regulatory domain-containing protein [Paraburkholderia edwinii]